MPYALFHADQQISKPHSTPHAALAEAYERKLVVRDKFGQWLARGYSIREIHLTIVQYTAAELWSYYK